MLDSKGFDLWADGYDTSVNLCEEANAYPFAGYKDVLNKIYKIIHSKQTATVLDIGLGTGILTKKLYDEGYGIYGIDFSKRMIEIAKAKMPDAILLQHDFAYGLPQEVLNRKFDYIISTYAFHHLSDTGKIEFITQLRKHLSVDGMVLIGDIIFETRIKMDICRELSGDSWDSDEIYIVFDEIKKQFLAEKISFYEVSHCAGIVTIIK